MPPEALFSDYLYFSSYSDTFLAHARAMAEGLVARLGLGSGHRALEIASNDGYLLQYLQPLGLRVLGVEPAAHDRVQLVRLTAIGFDGEYQSH